MRILTFLIIGILAGWLAGEIVTGEGFGLLGNLVVGVIGAFVGGFLMDLFGRGNTDTTGERGFITSFIMSTIGAVVFLAIINLIF